MNSLTDPVVVFIIVLLIGIVAGCLAQWVTGTSWLSNQITGNRARLCHQRARRHCGIVHRIPHRLTAQVVAFGIDRAVHRRGGRGSGDPVGLESDKALTARMTDFCDD